MKKQNMFLRVLCVLFATVMLLGMLSACNDGATEPTIPEDPTGAPGGETEDPDSPFMDGDDHIEIDW